MISKYSTEFNNEIVRLGAEGKSLTQIAAAFRVTPSTLSYWAKSNPEFAEAKTLAVTLAEAYWEDIGQKGTKGVLVKFIPVSWIYMMKCRFRENWKEDSTQRIELYNQVKTMSDQEIDDTIKAIIAKKGVTSSDSGESSTI